MTNELNDLLDCHALLMVEGLGFEVQIKDCRTAWGRIDCEIVPIHGTGSKWVSKDRLVYIAEGDF